MIDGDQIRMGRAAARLSVRALAKIAKVAPMTISRLENGQSEGLVKTLRKIQSALEKAGVEFINNGAPGVRLRKK